MAPKKNAREITRISKFFVGFYSAATQEQIFCCWWCPPQYMRTNIVSTYSLVRFLWASFSVCSILLGEKLFIPPDSVLLTHRPAAPPLRNHHDFSRQFFMPHIICVYLFWYFSSHQKFRACKKAHTTCSEKVRVFNRYRHGEAFSHLLCQRKSASA